MDKAQSLNPAPCLEHLELLLRRRNCPAQRRRHEAADTSTLWQHSQFSPPHALSMPTGEGAASAGVTPSVESMLTSRRNGLNSSVPGRLRTRVQKARTLSGRIAQAFFSPASTPRLGASGQGRENALLAPLLSRFSPHHSSSQKIKRK